MEAIKRSVIVAKAREYLGTPFRHQGRLKGHRMDCVGIVLCVAEELRMSDIHHHPFDRYWHSHYGQREFSVDRLREECRRHFLELPDGTSQIKVADVLLMRLASRDPERSIASHLAIVSGAFGRLMVIHAFNGEANRVIEHEFDGQWMRRIDSVFRYPEAVD